jgi:hypothetical protein
MLRMVLADRSGRFGKVSTMTLIASLGTRIIRSSPLSGFVTDVGYALGGFVFDYLFFSGFTLRGQSASRAEERRPHVDPRDLREAAEITDSMRAPSPGWDSTEEIRRWR